MPRPRPLRNPIVTLAFVAAFLMTSCHSLPVSPIGTNALAHEAAPSNHPAPPAVDGDPASQVPVVMGLKAYVRGNTLYLSGQLRPSAVSPAAFYDGSLPGGWVLQLLMNTDQADTGYPWRGIDYLVRGSERLPDGSFVVRRVEQGSDDPAGWGPTSGAARLTLSPRRFVLAVPLAAIGDDDGRLDFVLETYATVANADRPDGVSHVWAAEYAGSSPMRATPKLIAFGAPRLLTRESFAAGVRTTLSDTDARW